MLHPQSTFFKKICTSLTLLDIYGGKRGIHKEKEAGEDIHKGKFKIIYFLAE